MKNTLCAIGLCFMVSGCVSTGVMVQKQGDSEPLTGSAHGSMVSGSFSVSNFSGLSCEGSYNPWNNDPMLEVALKCSDGTTGKARVLRTGAELTDGSGYGVLSDGKKIRILLGNTIQSGNSAPIWTDGK